MGQLRTTTVELSPRERNGGAALEMPAAVAVAGARIRAVPRILGRGRRPRASVVPDGGIAARGRTPLSRPDVRAALAAAVLLAAAGVAFLTAENPDAQPPGLAVAGRLTIILVLLGAGLFAGATRLHARIGAGLLAAAPFTCLWLLNGSSRPVAFTIGCLFSAAAPAVFSYLMLAHPTGRLRGTAERRLLAGCTGAMAGAWALLMLSGPQPPLATPLLRCAPRCPHNVLFVGIDLPARGALTTAAVAAWLVLGAGTLVLLLRRLARANAPVRRVMSPVVAAGAANLALLVCFQVARVLDSDAAGPLGTWYVAVAVAIPFALLAGLLLERLFMGRALADFVDRLAVSRSPDVQALMAAGLHDPSLTVAYSAGPDGSYVDGAGALVEVPPRDAGRSAVVIDRGQAPVAVLFDSQLAEQERYIQAAGEAAVLWLEGSRLAAEHAATTRELAVSRRRLLDAAVQERARIQRDLHDGAQQRLLGMRAKVNMALSAAAEDPTASTRMLGEMQRELGETLDEVRALANGVFPPLLLEYGLGRALKSACRRSGADVTVSIEAPGRFSRDIEGAVYFTCLEALQNLSKHAGADARGSIRLWREDERLRFEVRDSGVGFAAGMVAPGDGTVNMHDRIAAVGGTLWIDSAPGAGAVVSGTVPLASSREPDAAAARRQPPAADARER